MTSLAGRRLVAMSERIVAAWNALPLCSSQ